MFHVKHEVEVSLSPRLREQFDRLIDALNGISRPQDEPDVTKLKEATDAATLATTRLTETTDANQP